MGVWRRYHGRVKLCSKAESNVVNTTCFQENCRN